MALVNTSDLVATLQQELEEKLRKANLLKKAEEEAVSRIQDLRTWLDELAPELTECIQQHRDLFYGLDLAQTITGGEPVLLITGPKSRVSIRFEPVGQGVVQRRLAYCISSLGWVSYGGPETLETHSREALRASVLGALHTYLGIDNGRQ